jgi:hypothetical protein
MLIKDFLTCYISFKPKILHEIQSLEPLDQTFVKSGILISFTGYVTSNWQNSKFFSSYYSLQCRCDIWVYLCLVNHKLQYHLLFKQFYCWSLTFFFLKKQKREMTIAMLYYRGDFGVCPPSLSSYITCIFQTPVHLILSTSCLSFWLIDYVRLSFFNDSIFWHNLG